MTSDAPRAHQRELRDTLISIQDAANTAQRSVVFLLEAASNGELELLTECRAGRHLVLRPNRPGLEKEIPGVPHLSRTPDYLTLGGDTCRILTIKPSTYFAEASYGYRHSLSPLFNQFERLNASEADDSNNFPVQIDGNDSPKPEAQISRWGRWKSWALWTNGQVETVPLRRDDIFLRLLELYRWMDIAPRAVPIGRKRPHDNVETNSSNNEYKSDQLLRMTEASFNLWGNDNVLPSDSSTHPTTEQVCRWLLTTGIFTSTQAANAAALIKPSWGNRGGRPQK